VDLTRNDGPAIRLLAKIPQENIFGTKERCCERGHGKGIFRSGPKPYEHRKTKKRLTAAVHPEKFNRARINNQGETLKGKNSAACCRDIFKATLIHV